MKDNLKNIMTGFLLSMWLITGCSDDDSIWSGDDNYISSFQMQVGTKTYAAVISSDSIILKIPGNVLLEDAVPVLVISELATITPEPSSVENWELPQTFKLTSYNGNQKTYYYSLAYVNVVSEGDVVLTSQAAVDAFAEQGINEITGSLTIGATAGEDSIISLETLTGLMSVSSALTIHSTYAGSTLRGLENLEQVGSLEIDPVPYLQDAAFPALKSVMNDLTIKSTKIASLQFPVLENVDNSITLERNDSVAQIDFSSLKSVGNNFIIRGGGNDVKLSGISLPALETVQGELQFYYLYNLIAVALPKIINAGSVHIYADSKLENISMPVLQEVFKDIRIYDLNLLSTLDLSSMSQVGGDVYLQNLALLQDLEGLRSLTTVGGTLNLRTLSRVNDISPLSSFTGAKAIVLGVGFQYLSDFQSLKYTESLTVTGATGIKEIDVSDIEGLTNLRIETITDPFRLKGPEVFEGTLHIQYSDFNLEGFQEVDNLELYDFSAASEVGDKEVGTKKVNGSFYLNAANMSGTYNFPELESVDGRLTIDCQVPVAMPVFKEAGELYSRLYAQKEVILSLPALEKVNGDCNIQTSYYINTYQLTDIRLPSLTTVAGILTVSGYQAFQPNTAVTNLNGLSALTSAGSLLIRYNSVLTDYSGLQKVVPSLSSSTCTITGNAYNPGYESLAAGKWTPED